MLNSFRVLIVLFVCFSYEKLDDCCPSLRKSIKNNIKKQKKHNKIVIFDMILLLFHAQKKENVSATHSP